MFVHHERLSSICCKGDVWDDNFCLSAINLIRSPFSHSNTTYSHLVLTHNKIVGIALAGFQCSCLDNERSLGGFFSSEIELSLYFSRNNQGSIGCAFSTLAILQRLDVDGRCFAGISRCLACDTDMVDLGGVVIKLVVEILDVENQTGSLALQCHFKLAVFLDIAFAEGILAISRIPALEIEVASIPYQITSITWLPVVGAFIVGIGDRCAIIADTHHVTAIKALLSGFI